MRVASGPETLAAWLETVVAALLPSTPVATTAALISSTAPTTICTLGRVKCADPKAGRSTNSTTMPTAVPIAKPPTRKASSWSSGCGRLIITTVMPIRNGSRLTATAITRSVIHIDGVTLPALAGWLSAACIHDDSDAGGVDVIAAIMAT